MELERKAVERNDPAAAPVAAKVASSKVHASPPPALLTEPGEDAEVYATGAFLGKGGFAVCYEGTLTRNGKVFALKVVKSEMQQKKLRNKFRTELQIHAKMRHPHIVQFYRAFAYGANTYIVLELCPNGSIMEMVRKRKGLSLPEVRRFMVQLCGAVKYLHKRNVAHRDLKMGNLFLDQNMDIKVGDFGLAALVVTETEAKRRKTLCGTPNYIAPEVLDKTKNGHTQKVDIWSLGVICFAMLTSYPPFQSTTQEEIYQKVRNLTYVWPKDSDCVNRIPEEAKSLVSSCLSLAEEQRPEADDIVEHPFFSMYDGCIPRQLDPACRFLKPAWLRPDEPRGDCIAPGYSLAFDPRYRAIANVNDPRERYQLCKDAFYGACGVGYKPDGTVRKAAGKNSSKSCYAECTSEEEKGLQPLVPLPPAYLYKYPHIQLGDWSMPESSHRLKVDADSSIASVPRSVSIKSNVASLPRTQLALAAAQQRRNDLQSHAATLRQQALPSRVASKRTGSAIDGATPNYGTPPASSSDDSGANIGKAPALPTGGFAERPIRTKRAIVPSQSLRDQDANLGPHLTKSSSVPNVLTVGKTRSQSRRLEAAKQQEVDTRTRAVSCEEALLPKRSQSLRSLAKPRMAEIEKIDEAKEADVNGRSHGHSHAPTQGTGQSNSKGHPPEAKSRSSLGTSPLFHSLDECELLPGTSLDVVNERIKSMLANMVPRSSGPRESGMRRKPHSYVIKWVDYTNRYGIGYVLDDGSVGCVFKAMNGRPASCVVMRDGERHIRRRARRSERRKEANDTGFDYESQQLVAQNGLPVEFYEEHAEGPLESRGVRRAKVPVSAFEVKQPENGSSAPGIKIRSNLGAECSRSDAEKIKRVKLVDQFGKYMIGSLGRHGAAQSDDVEDPLRSETGGQYIKYYQRLGNVGVWGFGDGAFQFNFPDHTKLVISPGRTKTSSPWIDFYHLSPAAARFLAENGKMHPSGFDTRAVASDEAVTLFNIARGQPRTSVEQRIHDILTANLFMRKIGFVQDVFKGWMKCGRLGGRPAYRQSSADGERARLNSEIYWEGSQELGAAGAKFVWVTVGAPGGDGEYVAVTLTPDDLSKGRKDEEQVVKKEVEMEVDALTERLRSFRTRS